MTTGQLVGTGLLLVAALLASAYRLLIKLSGDRLALVAGFNGVSVLVGLVAIWFVPPLDAGAVPYLIGSSAAYSVAMGLLVAGYRHGAFSVVTPLQDALRVLTAAILAVVVLDEQATGLHAVAIVLVAVALFVQRPPAAPGSRHGVVALLALGAGIASGLQYTVDVGGVRSLEHPETYVVWNLFIGLPIVLVGLATRPGLIVERFRSQGRWILGGSVLDMVGYALVLAVSHWLAVVEILPVLNLRIVISSVLGAVALKEGFAGRRVWASGLLLAAAMTVQFA